MKNKYKKNYSTLNRAVLNKKMRLIKAEKAFSVIKDYLDKEGRSLKDLDCLDIGGSAGFIAKKLASYTKKVIVIDKDKRALEFGKKYNYASNIHYFLGDAMDLKLADKSIDIIVCNHIYEHVSSFCKLTTEIYRVLKDDGICYFGAGNKFILMEPHYHLPLLSWLPKSLANLYLRTTKKGTKYYENLLSYYGLLKKLYAFKVYDYTTEVIKNPVKYCNADSVNKNSGLAKIPTFFLNLIKPIIPTYIFILTKKK